ncbi:MAG: M20/M25/M40 family metallo-hydrolase [Coriobacteriales bacterium]|jgi:endoglucanase|nr:M20/M25/M40 family metallo-hydrolase [Coriobacteriales bacterium]
MNKKDLEFLKALTEAPSPSGFEAPAARILRERLASTADTVETNVLGSVHATLKGTGAAPSVMIAGHIDEVGMMVKYISDEGFISFEAIGGVDAAILPGTRVNVYATGDANASKGTETGCGALLRGVMGRKPIHLIDPDERKKVTSADKLFIDVGLDGKEAKRRIRIGDAITYGVGFEEFGDGYAVARAFDDKLGVWIAVRVLEEVKKAGRARCDVIAAGTVQEEIGLRGGVTSAYGVNPVIGISAEVGHATDYPDIDKRKHGEAVCGKGPIIARGPNINPLLFERLIDAAAKTKSTYQIGPEARATGTDANAIQLSRGGKVAGLVSIPLRYMHTPTEVLKLADLDHAIRILTRFVLDLDESADFIPR